MSGKLYVVGNWKMHQKTSDIEDFFRVFSGEMTISETACEFWIAPQALHVAQTLGPKKDFFPALRIGGQDISFNDFGAFTGEISPASLKDLGADFTLVGHSERRRFHRESDEIVNLKILKALEFGLIPILCVGETEEERKAQDTKRVLAHQLQKGLAKLLRPFPSERGEGRSSSQMAQSILVAYEPVWAIGTGIPSSSAMAQEAHKAIREELLSLGLGGATPIIYGGSVNADNVEEFLSQTDIDGVLVGGAALNPKTFAKICQMAHNLSCK